MLRLIEKYHIAVLNTSDEVIQLAEQYIANNIIPAIGTYLLPNQKRCLIMKLTTDIEDAVDAIRDKIYEETKNMIISEEVAYFNAIAEEAKNKYGFRVVKSAVKDVAGTIHSTSVNP